MGRVAVLLLGALFWSAVVARHSVKVGEISQPALSSVVPHDILPHVQSDTRADSVISNEWAVKLKEGAMDVHQLAHQHGFDVHGPVGKVGNLFVLKEKKDRRRSVYPELNTSQHVEWAEQQVYRRKFKRDGVYSFDDPSYGQQWHLHDENGKDMNVRPVWDEGYFGRGCQVAVVDDALQHDNEDIKVNYDPEGSWDFNYDDPDPDSDRYDDTHGTSAAGCAVAAHNSVCGVGTAPHATVSGIRLLSLLASDAQEAAALTYEYNRNHVYSNSWGPDDDGQTMDGPGRVLGAAFSDGIQHGREGKGSVYVWAAGNGKQYGDNGNMDGYNNKVFTISIGSYDYGLRSPWYSEECACLHAVAPSSGESGPGIFTTSQNNEMGHHCRGDFGGTSASAPMAAGVFCLILGAHPELTWRDLQHLVVRSAIPLDTRSTTWQQNGAGLKFSHTYGFGKLNGKGMLDLAKTWRPLPPQVYLNSGEVIVNERVPASRFGEFEVSIESSMIVEHLSLYVDVEGIARGDLTVSVESPHGMISYLAVRSRDRNYNMNWIMSSNAHWGEDSQGTWLITFGNGNRRSTMTVKSYQLLIDGYQD